MKKGFSLMEIVVVLAILGLVMGLVLPSLGQVKNRAERMAFGQQMRQLGIGVALYQETTQRPLVAGSIWDWVVGMAETTGISQSDLYVAKSDPLMVELTDPVPLVLASRKASGSWGLVDDVDQLPLSVTVVSGIPTDANPSTTPVAWTRGLTTQGVWSPTGSRKGVYGGVGGFIVFLDGHLKWYSDLRANGGLLLNFKSGERTSNIKEALPDGAKAYDFMGRVF